MIYVIPITASDPSFRQEVALDGTTYQLQFRWNDRDSEWFMGILDLDDTWLLAPVRLVEGMPLLRHIADFDNRPPGELLFLGVATETNLGEDAILVYLDEDEVS